LVARDIEVEFVNFGKSLPQMLVPVSTPKVAKPGILENSPVGDGDGTGVRLRKNVSACRVQLGQWKTS
jgi:hypothetical protein